MKEIDGRQVLVYIPFGSHLYGTNTPESDKDFKGIFMPTLREILLGETPKSIRRDTKKGNAKKNSPDDVDCEVYSLPYFLELACKGETVAIDMLHCPDGMCITTSDIWKDLRSNRSKFYTKNLKSFVSYCRKQAAKYGIKGSRLNALDKVIKLLEVSTWWPSEPEETLGNYWDALPVGEHTCFLPATEKSKFPMYQVCGKKFHATAKVSYVVPILQKTYETYGHRAQRAKENKGIDWKAVSHAMRAAYQLISIYVEGDIKYPLHVAQLLRDIKVGGLDYTTIVAPMLEAWMDKVECYSSKSTYPDKVDHKNWKQWLINQYTTFHKIRF